MSSYFRDRYLITKLIRYTRSNSKLHKTTSSEQFFDNIHDENKFEVINYVGKRWLWDWHIYMALSTDILIATTIKGDN